MRARLLFNSSMTLALTKVLIARPSITPDDAGCQRLIAERLERSGFAATHLPFAEVSNLWAAHGQGSPVFVFLGHTDVVPAGEEAAWDSPPFQPEERDGFLYGRGAADMKGSVAAMVTAMERFVSAHGKHPGTIAMLLTSDEEGVAINGTQKAAARLKNMGVNIDWCLVGEPSSRAVLGDAIKNGRRGSLSGALTVVGVQGHVAYPATAKNPIHLLSPALDELCRRVWDEGDAHYPPTSFQVSNLQAGTGAENVIPATAQLSFNLRFSTAWSEQTLKKEVEQVLRKHGLDYALSWRPCSQPYLSRPGRLLEAVQAAVAEVAGATPELSTDGGTSDGRFIAPMGAEVVELGPVNATIHKVNEHVRNADLETLSALYEAVLNKLMAPAAPGE